MSRELVDMTRPVEVTWNNMRVFEGKLEREFETLLATALDMANWMQTFECSIGVRCP